MMKIAGAALLAMLCGCQSKSVDEMSYTEVRQYAGQLVERCRKQGAKVGMEMQTCINQEARSDEAKRRNAIQTRQAIGAALAEAGQAYDRSIQANRPVNCTSNRVGTSVYTSCL